MTYRYRNGCVQLEITTYSRPGSRFARIDCKARRFLLSVYGNFLPLLPRPLRAVQPGAYGHDGVKWINTPEPDR